MADAQSAWGIEIGQAGLKAIRLRFAEAAEQAIAVAFDYVQHPKILSQPDANPQEIIAESLQTFLSRNDVRGDKIVISVPGQTALARFIQLPPVEAGKVKDIVKFEARQQIPFALEEVIWDFQTLGNAMEEGGFILNAEVGLFAMKRDQVEQHLAPFQQAKVEVDVIQIAPLALYSFLSYDRLGIRNSDEDVGMDEHTIVLDMGADATTLLVSNGAKIWIRNVPIGGNHFTRALAKEQKLSFPKAEHLKCNATKSPDPRAVFGALRPVFNDYVSEIQRSIGFFSSVNRDARITKILGVGNGFKLAGLQKFLQQNLQYDVERVETFDAVVGDTVLNAGLFQDNVMSFVVPYGLALQGLGVTSIGTSLLPPEIITERTIRAKKPWATLAAASLLACLGISAAGYASVMETVSEERFGGAEQEVSTLDTKAKGFASDYAAEETKNTSLRENANTLAAPMDAPSYWLELYKAINEAIPRLPADQIAQASIENDPTKWKRVKVKSIVTEYNEDLAAWHAEAIKDPVMRSYMAEDDLKTAPVGGGYIVTLQTEHYHDDPDDTKNGGGVRYLVTNFLKNLQEWKIKNNAPEGGTVPVEQMGISHATIVESEIKEFDYAPNAPLSVRLELMRADQAGRTGGAGFGPGEEGRGFGRRFDESPDTGIDSRPMIPGMEPGIDQPEIEVKRIPRTSATVVFLFQPKPPGEETRPAERPASETDGEESAS